jgi:hypothetical protein
VKEFASIQSLGKIGEGGIVLLAGIYILVTGLTSKFLINETDVVATEEERARAKATPLKRLVCVVFGLACAIYGVIRMLN